MHHETDPQPDDASHKRAVLGSVCLVVSAVIVALVFVEQGGAPISFMPRSWYTNQPLWCLMAVGGFVAAYFLLRARDGTAEAKSSRKRPVFQRVVLYTRNGCHLCDDARLALASFHNELPAVQEIDIDTDPGLVERFGTCVPVVEIDGVVRFRGRVNEVLLRRLIDGTGRQE
ncbi:MAG: glutaredoxin family protein [Planctomycetaceae bacterium]